MAHKIILLVDDDANFAELTRAYLAARRRGRKRSRCSPATAWRPSNTCFTPERAAPEEMPEPSAPGPQHASDGWLPGAAQDARRGAARCSSLW